MKRRNIKIILLLTLIILAAPILVAQAATQYHWQVPFPGVNLNALNNLDGVGDLVNVVIRLAYRAAMLFTLYKILAIGFMYMTGQGKADVMVNVSKGMKNILIGILILFGSYLILFTINPDLVKLPNNLNCAKDKDGQIVCDRGLNSKFWTQKDIICPEGNILFRIGRFEFGVFDRDPAKANNATSDNNIPLTDITNFVDKKSSKFKNTGDWSAAYSDLQKGKTALSIWNAIKQIQNNWPVPEYCDPALEFGPIKDSHLKQGEYKSCHDSFEAIDLVVYNKQGQASNECMQAALAYIENNIYYVKVCDETMFSPPHLHIQDETCNVPCRSS